MPSRNAISVGIEVMLAAPASCCSASVSTFPKTTSGCVVLAASYVGANWRHGPHQDAQKSTSTMSLSRTVFSNASVVMSMVLMDPSGRCRPM